MNTEEKRLREQRTVDEMIRLYCRKKHGTRGGGLCPACGRLAGLFVEKEREMSLYGTKNILLQLQSTVLSAGKARRNPTSHALCGTEDAVVPSGDVDLSHGEQQEREKEAGA